jgi:hypothetical protein
MIRAVTTRELPSPNARRIAWLVAIGVDATQALLPILFGPGLVPWEIGLDLLAMGALTRLIGWHWAFLPTFAIELVPVVDLVPTWTAAMWIVSRSKR